MVEARGLGARAGLVLALVAAVGCRVPREVHEPREYPAVQLAASEINAVLVDAREPSRDPSARQLLLPADFEARVQRRLASLASGAGPSLGVIVNVEAADLLELTDARGEMSRVLVRLELTIKRREGSVLRRAETQSTSDLPREEATPEEVAFVLDATAIDAFDRYFADASVLESLGRDLGHR